MPLTLHSATSALSIASEAEKNFSRKGAKDAKKNYFLRKGEGATQSLGFRCDHCAFARDVFDFTLGSSYFVMSIMLSSASRSMSLFNGSMPARVGGWSTMISKVCSGWVSHTFFR